MKRRILSIVAIVLVLAVSLVAGLSPTVHAEDPLKDACKGVDAKKSATCHSTSPTDSPLTGTDGLIYKVSVFLSSIAGVIAVIMIMVGGFKYVTSSGDAQQATSARKTIVGAVVGLIIIVLAETIITFVVRSV